MCYQKQNGLVGGGLTQIFIFTILNFVSAQRENLGVLNGIYSNNSVISEMIIENNIVISNGENGISLNGEISNSKIINNTVVNPYFGLAVGSEKINTPKRKNVLEINYVFFLKIRSSNLYGNSNK